MTREEKSRIRSEMHRRAKGSIPWARYIDNSVTKLAPWKLLGVSRPTFYRMPKVERDNLIAKLREGANV